MVAVTMSVISPHRDGTNTSYRSALAHDIDFGPLYFRARCNTLPELNPTGSLRSALILPELSQVTAPAAKLEPTIITVQVTRFLQNARLIFCPETRDAVVVDPGADAKKFLALAIRHNLNIKA